MPASTDHTTDAFRDYLQVSPNLLTSLGGRTAPFTLYTLDEKVGAVQPLATRGERMGKALREAVQTACERDNLFFAREDYADFATHVSKDLGMILNEHVLGLDDMADAIHGTLCRRFEEFIHQPTDTTLETLRGDASVFSEFIWADSRRATALLHHIKESYELPAHSVNTAFTGTAMFCTLFSAETIKRDLGEVMIALLLHDMGMSVSAGFVYQNDGILTPQDKTRMRQHVDVGLRMLRRFKSAGPTLEQVVGQHHERVNGRGYPDGKVAKDISPVAQLCGVADSYAAMVAGRPYRPVRSAREAVAQLLTGVEHDKRFVAPLYKALVAASQ